MKRKRRGKQKEDAEIFIRPAGPYGARTGERARGKEGEREKESWSRKRMNKA